MRKIMEKIFKRYPVDSLFVCEIYLSTPDLDEKTDSTDDFYYRLRYVKPTILYDKYGTEKLVDPVSHRVYTPAGDRAQDEHLCYKIVEPLCSSFKSVVNEKYIPLKLIKAFNKYLNYII